MPLGPVFSDLLQKKNFCVSDFFGPRNISTIRSGIEFGVFFEKIGVLKWTFLTCLGARLHFLQYLKGEAFSKKIALIVFVAIFDDKKRY